MQHKAWPGFIQWLALGVIVIAVAACKGSDVNLRDGTMVKASAVYTDEGVIKLAEAVRKGKSKQIKALIAEGVDPNARGKDGYNLLMWAMLNRSKKGLVALLEAGADPAVKNDEGNTILHWTASANDPSYLTLLLEQGVDPNLRGKSGASALVNAVMGDREENFKALLAAGADPNARSNPVREGSLGRTILHVAASTNSSERVLDLLAAGADPNARDGRGDTFQRSFFMTSEEIMTTEGKARRQQVRDWLRERNIPVEDGR
ncbi:MAG TPA: ankyrin repeat domain-containing protein [Gammaproteobacteria bacterium]|nr:ankyrin repeat domain-containing protein [Gammaproteobacteria bacterium]